MLMRKLTTALVGKLLTLKAKSWLVADTGSFVVLRGLPIMRRQPAPVAMTTSATIASTAIMAGLITANQGAAGAATYTMPTGAVFEAAVKAVLGKNLAIDDSMDFTIVNVSTVAAEDVTVAGGATGMTAVGNMTIASNAAVGDQAWGTFRVRKTAAETFSFYRIG